jgi:hypothetical protein
MKLKLFQQLKNAGKWVFNYIEKAGQAINEAEEKIMFGDKNDSNKG